MTLFVSVPNAAVQFSVGAVFASIAVLVPAVARWTALGLVLGVMGLAAIIVAFSGAAPLLRVRVLDSLLDHAGWLVGSAPLMAPSLVGLLAGKLVTGLLIGR